MRKPFIDNLRILCIFLLFPYHTCMIYNNWGELFYITGTPEALPSIAMAAVFPWWMTLLFTLAGISSYYALQKRTVKEYVQERVKKLWIPLIAGILVIVPVQSYIADVFYTGYSKGYLAHYKVFFTRFTDLSGQDGGFTTGHLWFILYLFIISLILLPFMNRYIKSSKKRNTEKITVLKIAPLFLVILLCTPVGNIGGKSLGEFMCCFAIGFFVLSSGKVQEKIEKSRWSLSFIFLSALILRLILFQKGQINNALFDIDQGIVTWFGILTCIGFGKKYFNQTNYISSYFSKAAFPLYFFHQSILVIIGYFTLKSSINNVLLQFSIIVILSFCFSILVYELCKRFKVTSIIFGIK